MQRLLAAFIAASALGLAACDSTETGGGGDPVDPTPENKAGVPSKEFEPDDIERAEEASDAVKEYCSGAVSEAQRVGCESHVDETDIP
jgi:hypothetical protein